MSEPDEKSCEAFNVAVTSFGSSVYRLAYNQLRSRQSAEDIFQDVFTILYTSDIHFEDDFHLKSWLLKVTANRCKNTIRGISRRRETSTDLNDSDITETLVDKHDSYHNPHDFIWEIVDQLPENLRLVTYLHYVEGYSTEEIAEITETSSTTARTRLFRARTKIKQVMEGGSQ